MGEIAAAGRWFVWPTREALSRVGVPRGRDVLDCVLVTGLAAWTLISAYLSGAFPGAYGVLPPLGLAVCATAAALFHRTTLGHRLLPSLGLLAIWRPHGSRSRPARTAR